MIKNNRESPKPVSLDLKFKIIESSDDGVSNIEIAHKLNMPRSTVYTIIKNKKKILNEIKKVSPLHKKFQQHNSLIADMEKLLIVWIEIQTSQHIPLTMAIIQNKAKSLFYDIKAKKGEAVKDAEFGASIKWYTKFKRRSNIHYIKHEVEPSVKIAAKKISHKLSQIINDGGYSKEQIFNVDETELFWKKMPSRTLTAKEEKSIPDFKANKDRLTLLLGANASGKFKLKPMLVYHSEKPTILRSYAKTSLPIHCNFNTKPWVTASLFEEWFSTYFASEVKEYCAKNNIPFKILLLLDDASGHPQTLNDLNPNIQVIFLPSNVTLLLQPMSQNVIDSFKLYYLSQIFSKCITAIDNDEEDSKEVLKKLWEDFTILDGIEVINNAWNDVKLSTLQDAWRKLCPQFFNGVEDTENPISEITANIVEMGRQLELEIEPEELSELLESHSKSLSNEDLLELADHWEDENVSNYVSIRESKQSFFKELSEDSICLETSLSMEKIDLNFKKISKENYTILNGVVSSRDFYKEKKRQSTDQISLDTYFQKQPTPTKNPTRVAVSIENLSQASPFTNSTIQVLSSTESLTRVPTSTDDPFQTSTKTPTLLSTFNKSPTIASTCTESSTRESTFIERSTGALTSTESPTQASASTKNTIHASASTKSSIRASTSAFAEKPTRVSMHAISLKRVSASTEDLARASISNNDSIKDQGKISNFCEQSLTVHDNVKLMLNSQKNSNTSIESNKIKKCLIKKKCKKLKTKKKLKTSTSINALPKGNFKIKMPMGKKFDINRLAKLKDSTNEENTELKIVDKSGKKTGKSIAVDTKHEKIKHIDEGILQLERGQRRNFPQKMTVNSNLEDAEMFLPELAKIVEEGNYSKDQIFNVDETGLFWKKMPSRTFISKEEKAIPDFMLSKDRLALLLGANASGTLKLKPLLIYHAENPRALKNYNKNSLPVIWKSNSKARVTAACFEEWYTYHFIPTVKIFCRQQNIEFKILLIVNNAPVHTRTLDEINPNVKVFILPLNTNALLQPMNRCVIAAFNAYYFQRLFTKLIASINDKEMIKDMQDMIKSFWEDFTILDGVRIIRDAWQDVKVNTLQGAWKKLCPHLLDNFEEYEDPVPEVTNHIVNMARKLKFDVSHKDIAELLDGHSQSHSIKNLPELDEHREKETSITEDVAGLTSKILLESISHFEAGMSLLEKHDPNFEISSKVNSAISNAYACYSEMYREKKQQSCKQATSNLHFQKMPTSLQSYASTQNQIALKQPLLRLTDIFNIPAHSRTNATCNGNSTMKKVNKSNNSKSKPLMTSTPPSPSPLMTSTPPSPSPKAEMKPRPVRVMNYDLEALKAPFSEGWRRLLVRRGISKKKRSDTYYFTPCGKKLRSCVQVMNYMENITTSLTAKNFCFGEMMIGVGEPHEIEKHALVKIQKVKKPNVTSKKKATNSITKSTNKTTEKKKEAIQSEETPITPTCKFAKKRIRQRKAGQRKRVPNSGVFEEVSSSKGFEEIKRLFEKQEAEYNPDLDSSIKQTVFFSKNLCKRKVESVNTNSNGLDKDSMSRDKDLASKNVFSSVSPAEESGENLSRSSLPLFQIRYEDLFIRDETDVTEDKNKDKNKCGNLLKINENNREMKFKNRNKRELSTDNTPSTDITKLSLENSPPSIMNLSSSVNSNLQRIPNNKIQSVDETNISSSSNHCFSSSTIFATTTSKRPYQTEEIDYFTSEEFCSVPRKRVCPIKHTEEINYFTSQKYCNVPEKRGRPPKHSKELNSCSPILNNVLSNSLHSNHRGYSLVNGNLDSIPVVTNTGVLNNSVPHNLLYLYTGKSESEKKETHNHKRKRKEEPTLRFPNSIGRTNLKNTHKRNNNNNNSNNNNSNSTLNVVLRKEDFPLIRIIADSSDQDDFDADYS